MDRRLVEFATLIRETAGLPDAERYKEIITFVIRRDCAPSWYERLPAPQKALWAEARAKVMASLSLAAHAAEMTPEERKRAFPSGEFPCRWELLEALAPELSGESPNCSVERWLKGVQERLLISLSSGGVPWTKDHARAVCQDLLRSTGRYSAAYKRIVEEAVRDGVDP